MMKMFLLLAVASVVIAGALPSLPARIILSAFVILAALIEGIRRAGKHRKINLMSYLNDRTKC